MSAPNSPRCELAAAAREVAAAAREIEDPPATIFGSLEAALATIDAAGDRDAALDVVECWRSESLRLLEDRLCGQRAGGA